MFINNFSNNDKEYYFRLLYLLNSNRINMKDCLQRRWILLLIKFINKKYLK